MVHISNLIRIRIDFQFTKYGCVVVAAVRAVCAAAATELTPLTGRPPGLAAGTEPVPGRLEHDGPWDRSDPGYSQYDVMAQPVPSCLNLAGNHQL